jgi:putative membrane protein insertion efficiency factor
MTPGIENPFSALALTRQHVAAPPQAPGSVLTFNPLSWFVLACIVVYRVVLPARWKRRCIYQPTCSRFAMEAIAKHGLAVGARKTLDRLRRCDGARFAGGSDPP